MLYVGFSVFKKSDLFNVLKIVKNILITESFYEILSMKSE